MSSANLQAATTCEARQRITLIAQVLAVGIIRMQNQKNLDSESHFRLAIRGERSVHGDRNSTRKRDD